MRNKSKRVEPGIIPATFAVTPLHPASRDGSAGLNDLTSQARPARRAYSITSSDAHSYPKTRRRLRRRVRAPRTRMIHNFQFKAQCSPATTFLIEFKPFPVV